MKERLFPCPFPEPSQSVGFAGNDIDRSAEHRADDAVGRALADPRARLLLIADGKVLTRFDGVSPALYFSPEEAIDAGAVSARAVLLGVDRGGPVLAAPAIFADPLPDTAKPIDIRSVVMQGVVDDACAGALAQGSALLSWHDNHGFCPRCGGPTQTRGGGVKRVCTACNAEHFPRTDPVAIMLAVAEDNCLLGRGRHFAPGMYSALAGFIEHGETLENAVRRETLEESGIRLGRVAYHASQPWPFPYSLMIGCFGEALNENVAFDATELEDCRWFARDEVHAMLAGTHPDGLNVPPGAAIATHLIRAWAEVSEEPS